MPIGAKLWEGTSKAVGRRINDVSDRGVHEEVSFVGQIKGFGRLKGMQGRIVGTDNYWEKISGENVTNGNACGVLTLQGGKRGEIVGFKALGLGKLVRRSPLRPEDLLSLIWFPDPPPTLPWMNSTIVIWEAVVNPAEQTITATAMNGWVLPSPERSCGCRPYDSSPPTSLFVVVTQGSPAWRFARLQPSVRYLLIN